MICPPRRAATAPNRKRRAASKSEFVIDDTGPYPTPSPSSGSPAPPARLGSLERKAYKEDNAGGRGASAARHLPSA
jgi:hypothetical protein